MYERKMGVTGVTICVEFKEYVFTMLCLGEAWGGSEMLAQFSVVWR